MEPAELDRAMKAFRIAIGRLGNQSAMAELLGLKQQTISKRLLDRTPLLSAKEIFAVEAATGVPREELRPDLYPFENDRSPPPARRPAEQPPAHVSCPDEGVEGAGGPDSDPLKGIAA